MTAKGGRMRALSRRMMGGNVFERFAHDDLRGVHYAVNVFIGATAVWLLLRHLAGVNPVYAIASMIAASDPVVTDARRVRARH